MQKESTITTSTDTYAAITCAKKRNNGSGVGFSIVELMEFNCVLAVESE